MRITNNMMINNMVYNLNQNLKTLEKLQYQQSGKKFKVPSDDPIGASKSLKFNTDISKLKQYKRNTKDALSWMTDTEAALGEIVAVLHRVNELTVDAANGTKTTDDLNKIREEVDELKEHLIQIGNTTHAGRHIFSGYKTDIPLLNEDGTYNSNFIGNEEMGLKSSEIFNYNIGVSEQVQVNIVGMKVFGLGEEIPVNFSDAFIGDKVAEGGDKSTLIQVFENLSNALKNNEPENIQKALDNIEKSMEQVLSVRAEVGAKMNRLELTEKKLGVQIENVTKLLSYNEDVNIAENFMHMNMARNVYTASLMTGAKIIQPTLVEFLR